MSTGNKTKKIILAATVTTVLIFSGVQGALAGPGQMKGPGAQQPCKMMGQQPDKATMEARDTFLTETTELRKSMAEKKAAMRALMKNTNPDPEQAAKLAGELFDLREQLRIKAKAAGLPAQMILGKMGDNGMMPCNGKSMGGKNRGNQMM